MKIIAIASLAALGLGGAFWPQEKGSAISSSERTKFLFHGVFEGLVEDGAQAEVVDRILENKDAWFVPKCPICVSVHAAFRAYSSYARDNGWRSPRKDGLPPFFGDGFSKETVEALKSDDTKRRHGALEKLVEKYITRRFAQLKMTQEEFDRMHEALKIGMKEGMDAMKRTQSEERFPSSCPSCEGAN
ncbi:MAG TPA: hypothetical protein VK661_12235 [Planctomycetota bacterium]|nr:hypothetical protein [Planctomycetota bacterium]